MEEPERIDLTPRDEDDRSASELPKLPGHAQVSPGSKVSSGGLINFGHFKPPLEEMRQKERIVELTNKLTLQTRQLKALETHIKESMLPERVARAKLADGRLKLEEEHRRLQQRVSEMAEKLKQQGHPQQLGGEGKYTSSVGEVSGGSLDMDAAVKRKEAAVGGGCNCKARVSQGVLNRLSRAELALKACQDKGNTTRREFKLRVDALTQELDHSKELALHRHNVIEKLTIQCKTLSDALESLSTPEKCTTMSQRTEGNRFKQALLEVNKQKKYFKSELEATRSVVQKQEAVIDTLEGEIERLKLELAQEQAESDASDDAGESKETSTDLQEEASEPPGSAERPETAHSGSTGKRRSTVLGAYFAQKSKANLLEIPSLPDDAHLETLNGFKCALDTVDRDIREKHSRNGGLKHTTLKLRNMLDLCNSFSMQRRKVNAEFGLCEAIAHKGPKSLMCEHLLLFLPRTRMQNIVGELWTVTRREEHMIELKRKPRLIEYMFAQKEPIHIEDFSPEREGFEESLTILFAKSKQALLLPVYSAEQDTVCGVIIATHNHATFSDLDESLLLLLATSVQENLNLVKRERELRQETALLSEIKQLDAINIDLTYQPPTVLAQKIEQGVSRLLMSSKAVMFFVDFRGGAARVWTTKSSHEDNDDHVDINDDMKWISLNKGTSLCSQVIHSGIPLITLDAYNHPAFNGNVDIGKQLQHGQPMICVPIKSYPDSFFTRWRERQKFAVGHNTMAVIQLTFEVSSYSNTYVFSYLQHKFTVLDRYCSRISAMVDGMWQYSYASQPNDFQRAV